MRPWFCATPPSNPVGVGAILLGTLLAGNVLRGDAARWWDRRWPWRRQVLVQAPRARLDGEEAAWVELPLHGVGRPGGPSIRVTTAAGKPVKHFVMQTGPGDLARVCFALSERSSKYFVYYGNPEAQAPDANWRPRRGVLLEGWAYRGGAIASFPLTQQTFNKAGEPQGRTFVPNVYLGHNPFDVPSHYCHRYTGWLVCPKAGRYAFSTTSKDASFLLVDETMVVQWPGRHPPVADARHIGRIRLDAGLHKLTYYHVSVGPNGRAVAAWQPPGEGRPVVIPPAAFAPIARGTCGDLDRYGTRMQADFTMDGPHEAFVKDRYTYRYIFEARLANVAASGAKFRWDFGDGITAEGARAEHVYLSAGKRVVALTARRGGGQSVLQNQIMVTRDWDQVTQPKLDSIRQQAKIVAGYALANLSPGDLASAVWLLRQGGETQACLAAVDALPARVADVEPKAILRTMPELYDLLITNARGGKSGDQASDLSRRAIRMFQTVETNASDVSVKAEAGVYVGRIHLEELGELEQAEAAFARVLQQYSDRTRSPAIRRARVGLGTVYLSTRRYRRAYEAFEQAGVGGERRKRDVRVGSYARAVEDYIRRKEYTAAAERLDQWEWEYPLEKLRGYSTLLRARLLERQKRYAQVVRLIEGFPMVVLEGEKPTDPVDVIALTDDPGKLSALYKIDPTTGRIQSASGTTFPPNPYGMEMGLLAAGAHVELKQKDQAQRVLRVLIQLYPDSPLIGQAKEELGKLGQ